MSKKTIAMAIIAIFLVGSVVSVAHGDTAASITIKDEANIRSGAGTAFSVVRVGRKGEQFEVLGSAKDTSNRTWYKIKIGSSAGFVAGWLVTYTPATVTPKKPSSTPAVTVTPVSSKRYAVVIEDGTALRTGAGTTFARLTTMKSGTSLPILAQAKTSDGQIWFNVDCSSLKLKQSSGYVASWVVKVKTVDTSSTTPSTFTAASILALWPVKLESVSRTVDAVNLRKGPSVLSDRAGTLASGSNVVISGYALNDQKETWCRVTSGNVTGWMYAPLLSVWAKVPGSVVEATVGRSLVSVSASALLTDVPFGPGLLNQLPAKGTGITGVATDGKQVYLELSTGTGPGRWVQMADGTLTGGAGLGSNTCSLTLIEVVASNGWTGVTIHIDGDKTGLLVARAHNPERIEVSLPSLVQAGQAGIAGVPTGQVSAIKVWTSPGGFVSKIVIYLTGVGVTMKQSVTGSTIQLAFSALGSIAPSKAVFLQNELLCGSEETLFADNATFMPLADIANSYGILLSWDATNQQTSLTFGDRQFVLKDGLRTLKIAQGDSHWNEEMTVAPRLVRGLLYVPVATIAHIFSLEASGDALRVYLDPVISSISLTGGSASVPDSITVISENDLKLTKTADGDEAILQLDGVMSMAAGTRSLASWVSVSSTKRQNDTPPCVKLQIHTSAAMVKIQNPTTGVYVIAVQNASAGTLKGRTVVLDPGHGYVMSDGTVDAGATGPAGTKESSINLAIAMKVKVLLEADGATVILTRFDDTSTDNPDLSARVQIANSSGADLFVSLHENATDADTTAGGTETHYWFDRSKPFAQLVQKRLVEALQRKDRGGTKTSLYLVSHIDTMPAVLIECAFISNPEEERLLREESFQQKTANAIEGAIVEYFAN